MPVARLRPVLLAALLFAPGCGKKEEDSSGPSPSADSGTPSSDIPKPPPPASNETMTWSRQELAEARMEATNKLKQIAIAFHAYHDANLSLPVGIYDSTGKKLGLSWRVQILPYIEEHKLYKEFKLDEPWDSEHNKKLIRRMPKLYTLSSLPDSRGFTHLRGFGGEGALGFYPGTPGQPGQPVRGPRLTDMTDGTSNTFLVCQLAEPAIWTKPDDPIYDAKKPLPKFGGVFEDGFYTALGDGSVRFVKHSTPDQVLRALITRAGGEIVPNY